MPRLSIVTFFLCCLTAASSASIAPPSCAAAPTAGLCFRGQELQRLKTASVGACCSQCTKQKGCATFEYTPNTTICKLLPAGMKQHSGDCQSGSTDPVPSPAPGPTAPTPGPAPGPGPSPPHLPALVQNRYGSYIGRKTDLAPEYPFLSGYTTGDCDWKSVEPINGHFNFTSCRAAIENADAHNKYLLINPATGPAAPMDWLAEAGIPTVDICFKVKNVSCPKKDVRQYPYYLADGYFGYWRRYHQGLHDMIKALPANLKERVGSVQVALGSTGDITPWHGTPLESKYTIDSDTWKKFWVNGSATMVSIWLDLLPTTKLLFNAVPPANATADKQPWPEYRHIIMDVLAPPNFDCKYGVQSHQYFTNYEVDDYHDAALVRTPFVSKFTGQSDFVRSRGEMSDGSDTDGPGLFFWNFPTWNLMGSVCWDLTFGLDVLDPNPQIWSQELGRQKANWSENVWPIFDHYHVYAGRKEPAQSPGAWIQLRDALDATDTERFPEAQFGDASACGQNDTSISIIMASKGTCEARVLKIVAAYADKGAVVQDMAAATASRHASRSRAGLNDVGLRIWPTNYAQYITQINASETSVGRWHAGSSKGVLGNYARMTDSSKGKSVLTFALNRTVFDSKAAFDAWNSTALHLRVGYFDEGKGSWQLEVAYSKAGDSSPTFTPVGRVSKSDSGEWIEARAVLGARQDISHLRLLDLDAGAAADDDTFGWLEVSKVPFVYNFTARVVNITTAVGRSSSL